MAALFDSARIGETLNTKYNHFDMTSVVLMSIRNLMPIAQVEKSGSIFWWLSCLIG